eukprot:SAG11_NODE_33412_length_277_cov_1.106742_1_plen_58_part_01
MSFSSVCVRTVKSVLAGLRQPRWGAADRLALEAPTGGCKQFRTTAFHKQAAWFPPLSF